MDSDVGTSAEAKSSQNIELPQIVSISAKNLEQIIVKGLSQLESDSSDYVPTAKQRKIHHLANVEHTSGFSVVESELGDDCVEDIQSLNNADSNSISSLTDVDIPRHNFGFDESSYVNHYGIKREVEDIDESPYSLNTELTIKTEPIDDDVIPVQDLGLEEVFLEAETNKPETTETFLSRNPQIFTKFSGLPDSNMFNALLDYIKDDIREIQEATKYEQLFSVLAKLHKNEDNLYLNKYIFPAIYVNIVELLYKKLRLLRRTIDTTGIPEILMPLFDSSQKVLIVGIVPVAIRTTSPNVSNKFNFVKYLIGYTAFGDVCFVSKRFTRIATYKFMLHHSGLLDKLHKDSWILFNKGNNIYAAQVGKLLNTKKPFCEGELYSKTVKEYTCRVVGRLLEQFKVLQGKIPDFMLYSKRTVSFLDKLVFVCCMILNMLPRCTYK